MAHHDDILNVYAYLREKANETAQISRGTMDTLVSAGDQMVDLDEKARALDNKLDMLLAKAQAYAKEQNIDLSHIQSAVPAVEEQTVDPFSADFKISLPPDFDYAADFQRLVEEAHKAGFTETRPEDILTEQELRWCASYEEQLDMEFCQKTELQSKDLWLMCIAAAIRVMLHYMQATLSVKEAQKRDGTLSADSGVDYGKVLKDVKKDVVKRLPNQPIPVPVLKNEKSILRTHTAFDVEDNEVFSHEDILGYDKIFGWLFGVANILTDTVTTKNMQSYSVYRINENAKPMVNQAVSTLNGVIIPVLESGMNDKRALFAAVFQEALEQHITKVDPQKAQLLMDAAAKLESENEQLIRDNAGVLEKILPRIESKVQDVAVTAMVNVIVSGIHAVLYDEAVDGELSQYSVRTRKIIAGSGAMATVLNSLPALATESYDDLDIGGIATTLISALRLRSTWIHAKAEFLTNNYTQLLDEDRSKLSAFFTN